MTKISIVVPIYNEKESIKLFYTAVEAIHQAELNEYVFEYWFIDDGSTDDSLAEVKALQEVTDQVHYVEFSRNFGKEAGLYAGLEQATGDYVVVMDVDLQDPPELLPEMVASVTSGEWDAVGTRRMNRVGDPKIRSWFSELFYKIINLISDTKLVNGERDYRIMNRKIVDVILNMPEYNRFSKGIFSWVGFKTKYLEFSNVNRVAGSTSWSFWKLFKYSLEGIVNFSETPLLLVSGAGILTVLASILGALFIIIRAWLNPASAIFGWPSMIVILLAVSGIQMFSLGIVGRYIASIFSEVKHRPIYIARNIK
ncbi:MAG: glycosyltransferase family 2 protein [Lactobacillaceae bacterium]|jgi:glycosyltransferase involved in cell wall biosynthesis|nr:glycosyltransferase family 2 protein [Lactobacillaceae bacterium]